MIRKILLSLLFAILSASVNATAQEPYFDALSFPHDGGRLLINCESASPIYFSMEEGNMVFEYQGKKYIVNDDNHIYPLSMDWQEWEFIFDSSEMVFPLGLWGIITDVIDYNKIGELPDWIEFRHSEWGNMWGNIILKENTTGIAREADIKFFIDGFDKCHTIHVKQFEKPFMSEDMQDDPANLIFFEYATVVIGKMMYVQSSGDTFKFNYWGEGQPEITGMEVLDTTDYQPLDDNPEIKVELDKENRVMKVTFPANESSVRRWVRIDFHIFDCKYTLYFTQMENGTPSFNEQIEALHELYTSTNGEKWGWNDGWLSDKYYSEWCGLKCPGKYITCLNLPNNRLVGEIPDKAIRTLIQVPDEFNISGNGLYGKLSDELQEMPQWQTRGLSILMQSPWYTNLQRFTNYKRNILLPDDEVTYLFNEEKDNLYNVIASHRLNHIMIGNPSEYRINQQLSYPDGFINIVAHQNWDEDRESTINNNIDFPFKDIIRLWKSLCNEYDYGLRQIGTTLLVDNNGYLVDIFPKDWSIDESFENNIIDDILKEYLGEPKEHDWFVLEEEPDYTSTDFSQDGEIVKLQSATVGKGVNVVFIGDGFVDKDMDTYESVMREGMDILFSMEPMRSLRDRFNVYMVKTVSPNNFSAKDGQHALDRDIDKIAGYVSNIPGVDIATTHTCLIENNSNAFFMTGFTDMFAEGGSLAVIDQGMASPVIIHEVAGHGIGKLLDEYIYSGYEDNHTQPGAEDDFKQWIHDEYHSRGWGMNISAESDPEKVPWARMLTDDYFKTETGIYQGAWFWPEELWRPSESSVMRNDYSRFNAPSREAIYKSVMQMSESDDWSYDFDTFKAFDRSVMTVQNNMPAKERPADNAAGQGIKHSHSKQHHIPSIIKRTDSGFVRQPLSFPQQATSR